MYMMGTEWLIWVAVVVVVLRLLTGMRHRRRHWLWYDDWLEHTPEDARLWGRGGRGGGRTRRGAYRLERRRAALEQAADRLEEASARLRSRAGARPALEDGRPSSAPSASSGSGAASGERVPARRRAASGTSSETPLEALQRRFAEGRITMEQYERELDKLYGLS
ncbi:MAG TPA: hypothetical protein VJ957_05200 [Longimicrobiales bacterium]|nr:hypothetical protein [Longimicrobiales bacterium]